MKTRQKEADRLRQEWNADVLEFHAMSKGAIEIWPIPVADLPKIFSAFEAGVPVAGQIISLIGQWLDAAAARAHGSSPALCMTCDTVFDPPQDVLPEVFVVHLPFADPKGALVSAICERCANNGTDWREQSMQMLRRIFPDAYRVEYPAPKQPN